MSNMEWDQEKTLELIEFYRAYPCLWDATHQDHKKSAIKNEAWAALSRIFECNPLCVKNKIDSLMASFRREKNKARKHSAGRAENYTSKWFAFKGLSFLLHQKHQNDKNSKSKELSQLIEDHLEVRLEEPVVIHAIVDDDDEEEDDDEVEEVVESTTTTTTTTTKVEQQQQQDDYSSLKKQNLTNTAKKPKLELESSAVAAATKAPEVRCNDDAPASPKITTIGKIDDCAVYGEHVACKLRHYSNRTKNIVQHYINNILFKADMGKYDTGCDPLDDE